MLRIWYSASSLILLTYPTSLYVNFKIPSIVHELGHALGMIHPMSRDDRDQYITLRAENINNGSDRNFLSISDRGYMYFTYGVPYDYKSIMHYNAKVIDPYFRILKIFQSLNHLQNNKIFNFRFSLSCRFGQRTEMIPW